MKTLRFLTIGFALCCVAAPSLLGQTTNFYCTNAMQMISGTNYTANTSSAPSDGGPAVDCTGNAIGHGVWYRVTTPTNNVRLDISTCGSSYRTVVQVYTNACGSPGSPVQCARGTTPFGCSGNQAGLSFSAPSNTTYHIYVAGEFADAGTLNLVANLVTPPPNDTCANPAVLTNDVTAVLNTFEATEFGDPVLDCTGNTIGHGVWYQVTTPTNNVRLDISTCGSSYRTVLQVYTNACGSPGSPVQCARGTTPFGCSGNQAGLSFSAPSNTTYYIYVAGEFADAGTLNLVANLATPPPNDICANPAVLTNGVTAVLNTFDATEFGEPATDCTGSTIGHGVWYQVTTPTNNVRLDISTCGSSYRTVVQVYTNACGSPGSPVQCARGSNPFGCSGNQAGLSFSAPSNTTYYVYVAGEFADAGTLNLVANLATPPPNDTCANPAVLTNGVTAVLNTFDATEFGEPVTDCTGSTIGHGVWYQVTTPTNNVRLDISTCGTSYRTVLQVYTNACGSSGALVQCARGTTPFSCSGNQAGLSFSAPSNTTYYIYVAGEFADAGTLNLVANLATPPPNDTCANPAVLTNGVTAVLTTFEATEFGEPVTDCTGSTIGHGVWYQVTTPTNNVRLDISTCGSSYRTVVQVYTNACGSPGSPAQCARGSNPFGCSGNQAGLSFSAPSNTTYYIYVAGQFADAGTLNLVANLVTPPPNDTCANPAVLINGVTTVLNTFEATEFGDPVLDCTGNTIGHGVWYQVTTPPNNVRLDISTCGSSYRTVLQVYTNACGSPGSPVQCARGSNPFGCSGNQAGLSFSAPSNTTYYIYVAGQFADAGTLNLVANLVTPPPNDTCASPAILTNGVTAVLNTFEATEFGEPVLDCTGNTIGHGVWYTLTAFSGQQVTISTCGSSYRTVMQVYTNACDSPGSPVQCARGSNPFGCSGNQAGLSFIAPTNTTYYILVAGQFSDAGNLNIVANVPPPTNDTCLGAIALTDGVSYSTNTLYATSIGDPVPGCSPSLGRGVWYRYTPSVSGQVGVTTCGSSFQTALAVYTGACGSLTEVACSQNSGAYCNSGNNADINFSGIAGTNYYILAGGVNGQAGNLQILIPVVDLVPTGLTATNPAGGLLTAGRNFSAGWSVQNQGGNSISGYWTDSLTLSNAVTNIVISQFSGPHNAPAGGSYSDNGTWNLGAIPAGTYTLIARADAGNGVAEVNKSNNSQTLLVTVTNIAPAITLLMPTNQLVRESCVAVPFSLLAQTQPGSYTIAKVTFYDGNISNVIGQVTDAPYSTNSLALGHGIHTIRARAVDSFGLSGDSTNVAMITIVYPTNLHVLRADIATNGDFVGCMCAYSGSNYVVESTTNVQTPTPWPPYATNLANANVLAFTNHPIALKRFFRARLLP